METIRLDRYSWGLPLAGLGWILAGLFQGLLVLSFGWKALGVLALGIVAAILSRPRLGLLLTVFIMFNLANPGILGVRSGDFFNAVTQCLGLLTALGLAWHVLTRRLRPVLTREVLLLLLFSTWALISTLYAVDAHIARQDLAQLIPVFCLFLLIIHLVRTPAEVERGLYLLFGVALVASAVALLQYGWPIYHIDASTYWLKYGEHSGAGLMEQLESSGEWVTRVSGTLWHHNWLALFLASVLPINLYLWRRAQSRPHRLALLLCTALELGAGALTFTRMGVVGVLFLLIAACTTGLLPLRKTAFVLIPAALILLMLLPPGFRTRVFSIAQLKKSDSLSSRSVMQRGGLEMFKSHWLRGVGFGNYGVVFNQQDNWLAERMAMLRHMGANYNPDTLGAHNMYLEAAAELGVVGLALLVGVLVTCLRGCRDLVRHYRSLEDARHAELAVVLQLCLLTFSFVALFLHALDQKVLWILMGLSVSFQLATWPERNVLIPAHPHTQPR